MPSEETADQFDTLLHHSLVCFESLMCLLHCAERKWQTSVKHSFITFWCVLNVVCFEKTVWCVLNAVCVPYTVL